MSNPVKNYNFEKVILGAGLSGLGAAYYGGGVIFEREKTLGGTCRSLCVNGFIFDLGIHVLHTKKEYILDLLSRNNTAGLVRKNRLAWIYSYGVTTRYPFQVNTYGLPQGIIKESLLGFIEVLNKRKKKAANYRDWIYQAFGKGIADNFYIPYSEKFWTVSTKELTTDWLEERVPRPGLEQVIKGAFSVSDDKFGPNSEFQYPLRGGIQQIARALIRKDIKINFSKEAKMIDIENKKVFFKDGSAVKYSKLITTIPLPELLLIINKVPQDVNKAAGALRHNSILCVNLGVKRQNITAKHWLYFPEDKFAAFRVSFPANFSAFTVPRGWSSIQAEISYSKHKPIMHKNIVDKVIYDLIGAKVITARDRVKLINTENIKYAYVIYDHSRLKNFKKINNFLRKNDIFTAGRYGRWEYLWMDDAIASGKDIAREANK